MRSDLVTDVERPWVDLVRRYDIVDVRNYLLQAGLSASQAAGVVFWLVDQASRRRDVSGNTAWRYRRLLESLEPPDRLSAIPGYLTSDEVAA